MKTKLHLSIATTWQRLAATARRFALGLLVLSGLLWSAPPGLQAQTNGTEEYTFLTLAGPAESGPGAVDGSGSAARFHFPEGVAVDSDGYVYVADTYNHTVRKISPAGSVATLAGLAGNRGSADGTGSHARFNEPRGVVVDSADNVYLADSGSHTIRKISPAGDVTTLAGLAGQSGSADGTDSAARFNGPHGLAVDSAGNLYVADRWNHTIRKISSVGVVTTLAGRAGSWGSADGTGSSARFNNPWGVAVDSVGCLYVADRANFTIRKIGPDGAVTTLAGNASVEDHKDGTGSAARFTAAAAVAVDGAGNVYVADRITIRKIGPGGLVTTLAGNPEQYGNVDGIGPTAEFLRPGGVAVDREGNVYVADTENCMIRKVSPAGGVTTLAGKGGRKPSSADGTGSAARFAWPHGVAVDGADNVYVADLLNCTIRKIAPGGVVTTLAGLAAFEDAQGNPVGGSGSTDGTGNAARFSSPFGVAVDRGGNVYVGDSGNRTIRKISPAGDVTTLAGLAGQLGSADGTGSSARFHNPRGVAVDSAGNLYVADSWNHTIRKVTPSGEVTTLAGQAGARGSADGTGSAARFNEPSGVAVDRAGNVYVAEPRNNTVRKISPAGVVTTLAGDAQDPQDPGSDCWPDFYADGRNSAARFFGPRGVAVDSAGNVYVADTLNQVIRKIDPTGQVTTLAGLVGLCEEAGRLGGYDRNGSVDGTGSAARFMFPVALAVDSSGKLYVADIDIGGLDSELVPDTIRIRFKACADRPVVDLPLASVGVTRQLDTSPQTATAWQWSWIRRPAGSRTELSSTTIRNPTFTPDVPDLYVFRLLATNQMTGAVSLRTVELNAVPANVAVLSSPQRLSNGSFQLTLISQTNQAYTLQVSTDFSAWTDWTNVTPWSFSTPLIDPDAERHEQRFYRVRNP